MNKKHAFLLITILLLTTIACEVSFGGNNEPSQDDINFELTRTALQQTQTALAQPSAPEPETSPEPDDDDSQSPPEEEDEGDEDSCYFSRWTGDETIPDGTVFDPGDSFIKTWTLRNAGECDWSTDTRMVFEDGDQLGGPSSVKLDRVVRPGETYVVEIPMASGASPLPMAPRWANTGSRSPSVMPPHPPFLPSPASPITCPTPPSTWAAPTMSPSALRLPPMVLGISHSNGMIAMAAPDVSPRAPHSLQQNPRSSNFQCP